MQALQEKLPLAAIPLLWQVLPLRYLSWQQGGPWNEVCQPHDLWFLLQGTGNFLYFLSWLYCMAHAELWALPLSSQGLDVTTMWYWVDWWNAQWSKSDSALKWSHQSVVLCWLVECTVIQVWFSIKMISPICGTLLTGGMHSDPSLIQHSNNVTTIWYCVDWWNAQWSESDSAFK